MDQANTVSLPDGADPSQSAQNPTQAGAQPTGQDPSNAYGGLSQSDVQQAMVQAVQSGDAKTLANLKLLNDSMSASAKTASASGKLSAAQIATQQAGLSALSSLKSLEQNLTSAGGAQGPAGSAATIPIIGQFLDPKGAAYQATLVDTATALAKAMTGGKPSAQSIEQWKHSLPQFNDTPAVVQSKLQQVRNSMNNKIQETISSAGGADLSSTLQDLMATSSGQ